MLASRGIPILRSYGRRVDTFVVAEHSAASRQVLASHGCELEAATYEAGRLVPEPKRSAEFWSCAEPAVRSRAVLVIQCDGTERSGCCRVMRFLKAKSMTSYAWIAFIDDDVVVPPCLSRYLPATNESLYAPAKHVGATGGWRWSLCGDSGRPDTEVALPAGYGLANRGFVRLLHRDVDLMLRQCATVAYKIDVAMSFASWRAGVSLTPMLDWTDQRVTWAGGQRGLWNRSSVILHKVRSPYEFDLLTRTTDCEGAPASQLARLGGELIRQTGYARTPHAIRRMAEPFDCQCIPARNKCSPSTQKSHHSLRPTIHADPRHIKRAPMRV
mmetsp:Transcript_14802/g.45195  ORF Transcript_14802/g.45195 Transcript_14802/m.45195 type:complete len:328 (+) Transcript_14802:326-1309(+)